MPGSGKTYFGQLLAQTLQVPFFDLDTLIENATGSTIPNLFQQGAAYFRTIETQQLEHFLANAPNKETLVLACGGGTPCFNNNMQLLQQHSITIWLDTAISKIFDNLQQDAGKRPLLPTFSMATLADMRAERQPYYAQAQHHIVLSQEIDSIFVQACIQRINLPLYE